MIPQAFQSTSSMRSRHPSHLMMLGAIKSLVPDQLYDDGWRFYSSDILIYYYNINIYTIYTIINISIVVIIL